MTYSQWTDNLVLSRATSEHGIQPRSKFLTTCFGQQLLYARVSVPSDTTRGQSLS